MKKLTQYIAEKLVINKNLKRYNEDKCLMLWALIWPSSQNEPNVVNINTPPDCKVKDNELEMNTTTSHEPILKRIDDYYFWKSETDVLTINVVGLNNYDGVEFLKKILHNIPENINLHDYFSEAADIECKFVYYDSKTNKKLMNYTSNDLEKFIEELEK